MAASRHPSSPKTVPALDLQRYAGQWYEIARFPHRFEENCVGVTATYSLRPDGRVDVVNRCLDKTLDGRVRLARGVARVPNPNESAKLRVRFFWPFEGDYWVLALGANYDYALVGAPKRDYLWILSRTPHMDETLYASLVEQAGEAGFDTTRLTRTPQAP